MFAEFDVSTHMLPGERPTVTLDSLTAVTEISLGYDKVPIDPPQILGPGTYWVGVDRDNCSVVFTKVTVH